MLPPVSDLSASTPHIYVSKRVWGEVGFFFLKDVKTDTVIPYCIEGMEVKKELA
jgi:hypothetical protein